MPDWVVTVGGWAVQIVTFGGAIMAIYGWFARPMREIRKEIAIINDDTGDLLCDRLTQAHDYYMREGYCPEGEKRRLCDLHRRYRSRGKNHLADSFEQDLLGLPDEPARKGNGHEVVFQKCMGKAGADFHGR